MTYSMFLKVLIYLKVTLTNILLTYHTRTHTAGNNKACCVCVEMIAKSIVSLRIQ